MSEKEDLFYPNSLQRPGRPGIQEIRDEFLGKFPFDCFVFSQPTDTNSHITVHGRVWQVDSEALPSGSSPTNPLKLYTEGSGSSKVGVIGQANEVKIVTGSMTRFRLFHDSYGSSLFMVRATGQPGIQLVTTSSVANPFINFGKNDTPGNLGSIYYSVSSNKMIFHVADVDRMVIDIYGNVAIGTTDPAGWKLRVNGSFTATSKSFDIPHPMYTDDSIRLRHGSLEGPEYGVYYRGKAKTVNRKATVKLPAYVPFLARADSGTVHVTPILLDSTKDQIPSVAVLQVSQESFEVVTSEDCEFFWIYIAERGDIDKLLVEGLSGKLTERDKTPETDRILRESFKKSMHQDIVYV